MDDRVVIELEPEDKLKLDFVIKNLEAPSPETAILHMIHYTFNMLIDQEKWVRNIKQ